MKSLSKVEQALQIFIPPPRSQRENYTLKRANALMRALGNPQDEIPIIHVAGTSGKTSTCYYLTSILYAAGLKVGMTVSPHVTTLAERVQINGAPIADEEFSQVFIHEFLPVVSKSGIKPTYFEILMAFAYWYFAREQVDVAVIETGLGGLLDGSNVVTRADKTCVITDIGLDHTEILGDTVEKIAAQKAGIIQTGNHVYMHRQAGSVMCVIQERADSMNATLNIVDSSPSMEYERELPLFQQRNWSLASATANGWLARRQRPWLAPNVLKQAASITIPARMEVLHWQDKTIVLDGAHNPQKLDALVAAFKKQFKNEPCAVLFACIKSAEQKLVGNTEAIAQLHPQVVLATYFKSLQDLKKESVAPERIARLLRKKKVNEVVAIDDQLLALKTLLERPEPVLLVTGSLYLIFDIRPQLLALGAQPFLPASTAIAPYCDDREDQCIAEHRLKNPEKNISNKSVRKQLGLGD